MRLIPNLEVRQFLTTNYVVPTWHERQIVMSAMLRAAMTTVNFLTKQSIADASVPEGGERFDADFDGAVKS